MKTLKLNGVYYRWEHIGGGKGLEIENKYITRPYCRIIFESDAIIKEPEKIVKQVLGVLFPAPEIEEKQRAFVCKKCGKVCKNNIGLLAHMRSHKKKEK